MSTATAVDQVVLTTTDATQRGHALDAIRRLRPTHPGVTARRPIVPRALGWDEGGRWAATNPSVAVGPWGAWVSIRLVNYHNQRATRYVLHDADGVLRSRTLLQLWDVDGAVVSEHELDLGPWASPLGPYQGLEDLRLFAWQGMLCFSASYAQLPGSMGVPRVCMGTTSVQLDAEDSTPDGAVTLVSLVELVASPPQVTEKNWMPISTTTSLRWVYSFAPHRALRWDPDACGVTPEPSVPLPRRVRLDLMRGSVGPVVLPGGRLLSLGHYYSLGDGRWYHHRWIEHDPTTLAPLRVSSTVCLGPDAAAAEVEFACGLALAPGSAEALWVTYGQDDRAAHLVVVPLAAVWDLPWWTVV